MKKKSIVIFVSMMFFICKLGFSRVELEYGKASYYSDKFNGRLTASGEVFDNNKMTAAHKTLPMGTVVQVINLDNNRKVEVVITDRGPFIKGRVIDLSKVAFEKIGNTDKGVVDISIEILK